MIADDEVDVVQTVRIRLEANGYAVSDTMGERTVKDVLAHKPDLLLLDVMMPGMDGLETLQQIKKKWPQTVVIMITALKDEIRINKAKKFGAANYIVKPFSLSYLETELMKQIEA